MKGIRPVKSLVSFFWWWRLEWSFARLTAPVIITSSFILRSNEIQNGEFWYRLGKRPLNECRICDMVTYWAETVMFHTPVHNRSYLHPRLTVISMEFRNDSRWWKSLTIIHYINLYFAKYSKHQSQERNKTQNTNTDLQTPLMTQRTYVTDRQTDRHTHVLCKYCAMS